MGILNMYLSLVVALGGVRLNLPQNFERPNIPAFSIEKAHRFASKSDWSWDWSGPEGGTVFKIAVDPTNPNLAYALTQLEFWRYNGVMWLPSYGIFGMLGVHAVGDGVVLAFLKSVDSNDYFVARSEDGGNTWTTVLELNNLKAVSEAAGDVVYIISEGRIMRSDDGGVSWTSFVLPTQMLGLDIYALDFSPLYPDTVYCACGDEDLSIFRIFRSNDGGETWNLVFEDTTGNVIAGCSDLEVKPTNPDSLIMGVDIMHMRGASLVISSDGGASWRQIFEGMIAGAIGISDVEFMGDTIYVATHVRTGLFKAYPFFGTWLFSTLDTVHLFYDIEISNDAIYASYTGGVMRIVGGSMSDITLGLRGVVFYPLPFMPPQFSRFAQSTLYTVDDWFPMAEMGDIFFGNMIYKTNDAGNSWMKLPIPNMMWIMSINTSAGNPDYVYASGLGLTMAGPNVHFYGLYRSTDGGNTFVPVLETTDPDTTLTLIFVPWVSPTHPDELLAYTWLEGNPSSGVLMKSNDGGENFTTVLTNATHIVDGTDTVYAVVMDTLTYTSRIMVSYDRGNTWESLGSMGTLVNISDLRYAPSVGKLYLIGDDITAGRGIYTYDLSSGAIERILDLNDPDLDIACLDVDDHGRLFVSEQFYNPLDSTVTALVGRMALDGTWEFDTVTPTIIATGIIASDTVVFALTPNHSAFVSSEAAFSVEEGGVVMPGGDLKLSVLYRSSYPVLRFELPYAMPFDLKVFDVTGRMVFEKDFGLLNAGVHEVKLGALPSGLYLYRLNGLRKAGKFIIVR